MTFCADGPCDRYLEAKRIVKTYLGMCETLPTTELDSGAVQQYLKAACVVCWWGEQPQPTKLQAAERQPKKAQLW